MPPPDPFRSPSRRPLRQREPSPEEGVDGEPNEPDEFAALAAELRAGITAHLADGDYLSAVRLAMDRGGLDLKRARGLVEHIGEQNGWKVPRSGCAALATALLVAVVLPVVVSLC